MTAGLTKGERTAAASLYVALMAAACLDLLAASGPTIVEGPFARNELHCSALAHLSGREVLAARGNTGTSAGAARLLLPAMRDTHPTARAYPASEFGQDLTAYAARWRRACVLSSN